MKLDLDDSTNCKCQFCGKDFTNIAFLRQHEAIHSDENAFGDDICTVTSKQAAALQTHKKNTLNAANCFTCDICDKKFYTKPLLYKHVQGERGGIKMNGYFSKVAWNGN